MATEQVYEWLPETRGGWTTQIEEHRCSVRSCRRPAVAAFYRPMFLSHGQRHTRRIWHCCAKHLYGRRIVGDRVEAPYLVGSLAWERAKEQEAVSGPA